MRPRRQLERLGIEGAAAPRLAVDAAYDGAADVHDRHVAGGARRALVEARRAAAGGAQDGEHAGAAADRVGGSHSAALLIGAPGGSQGPSRKDGALQNSASLATR